MFKQDREKKYEKEKMQRESQWPFMRAGQRGKVGGNPPVGP